MKPKTRQILSFRSLKPSLAAVVGGVGSCLLIQTGGAQEVSSPDALKTLVVTAEKQDESYPVKEASTATRSDTPIAKTPVSVQVIPRSVFVDQGVFRLKDVYRNVSGVSAVKTEGLGIQFENSMIRGFSQLASLDGVNLYTMAPMNLAGVSRVEVLKGPASSLYGAIEPGGLINVMPQVATATQKNEVYAEYGSYDYYQAGFVMNSPIGDDAALRIAGDYQDQESFRDFLHNQSTFFSPSFTWNISPQTRLTTWLWYQDLERPHDNGVVFTSDGKPTGSIYRNLAGFGHTTQDIEDFVYSLQLEHDLNQDLTLRGKVLVHNFEAENDAIRWSPGSVSGTVNNYLDASEFDNWQYNFLVDGIYKFDVGPTKHQFIAGIQGDVNDYNYHRVTAALPVIDATNPVYPTGPYNFVEGYADQKTLTKSLGGYIQEQMDALDDRLHVLLGGRVDYIDQFYRRFSDGREFNQYDTGYTGRFGVAYDLTPWLTTYTNVCRSFNPNTAGGSLDYNGNSIDPTTGLQYEAGVKLSLLDDRLAITSSVYQITKDNVPVSDPDHTGFSVNGGELRSQGFELDMLGQLTRNLQLIASYSYTDTEVLDSSSLPVGARFAGVPLQSGSLWLKYDFTSGPLENFGVGAGIFAVSSRPVDNNNTFDLAGYARFDTAMWYRRNLNDGKQLKLQLNVLNLFDTEYYESAFSTASVQPGTPCAAYVKCSLTF
ncbi:TonB-dependent siderophore receptor [Luteolibacter pohnpeiensis]|uniref:TonB-dependent siderophore receptor n=1 Tax=Luteolibacter pohnpeiensis TaxID=454153 RepID=A0A934VWA5_9BACT|nr:TonB-dependent siderophore receptor [Luteolibacter pohnpeiensis]MBK1883085.1 TonB-dependent siderophore receptor [Luteolibacter pohnpeiensis]